VAAGELFEVTDRGRPIARLVPITDDPWQDFINAGEVVPGSG
jgi:antitoxin (DNA-binding transcriptional repressor) of toxin-antitoxin stability system